MSLAAGLVLALLGGVPGFASDAPSSLGARPSPEARSAGEGYASVKDAIRAGVRNYNAGDKVAAVRALEYAAEQGHPVACWKLGRMYAEGDGVPRDDQKAFEYYSRIADENADEAPDSPRAGVVASAFVALGSYFQDGIKAASIPPNPERAAEMYSYAAAYFGDSTAQYNLGRLYLAGRGVERDERQAARWLNLAAEKGLPSAQALLGRMLLEGQGVPRERARGLMWLILAKQAADPKHDSWVFAVHADALEQASETERRTAIALAERYQSRRR
jgi:TPR repeat protein